MKKLFSVVVKLVVPASDPHDAEQAVNWLLTRTVHQGGTHELIDWGVVKRPDGTIPEPRELEGLDADAYQEGDAFREEQLDHEHQPSVLDFLQRWLPDGDKKMLDYAEELNRIKMGMISGEVVDDMYTDDAYRLWVEEFDEDMDVVNHEAKSLEHRLMLTAINHYLHETQR